MPILLLFYNRKIVLTGSYDFQMSRKQKPLKLRFLFLFVFIGVSNAHSYNSFFLQSVITNDSIRLTSFKIIIKRRKTPGASGHGGLILIRCKIESCHEQQ